MQLIDQNKTAYFPAMVFGWPVDGGAVDTTLYLVTDDTSAITDNNDSPMEAT